MATEIVRLQTNDNFTAEGFAKTLAFVDPLPQGLRSFLWGHTVEDAKTILWLLNWDSVKAHEDFKISSRYPAFVASVMTFCSAPVVVYHTHLQPFPPVQLSEAGIIELSTLAPKPEISSTVFSAKVDDFLGQVSNAGGYHCQFKGVKHEDPTVHIILVGWDSMESRTAAYTAEAVNQAREAMMVSAVSENSSVYNFPPQQ